MYMKNRILTAQHSTAQHSTAQHSTAQHSTAHSFLGIFFKRHQGNILLVFNSMFP
jgi:hypothetical protein